MDDDSVFNEANPTAGTRVENPAIHCLGNDDIIQLVPSPDFFENICFTSTFIDLGKCRRRRFGEKEARTLDTSFPVHCFGSGLELTEVQKSREQ